MKNKDYSILIKQCEKYFVALCPELNVAAQGDSLLDARSEIQKAIKEYLAYSKKTGVESAKLNVETLREFLLEDIVSPIRIDHDIAFSENFATSVVPA